MSMNSLFLYKLALSLASLYYVNKNQFLIPSVSISFSILYGTAKVEPLFLTSKLFLKKVLKIFNCHSHFTLSNLFGAAKVEPLFLISKSFFKLFRKISNPFRLSFYTSLRGCKGKTFISTFQIYFQIF
jgi:hypothetical protein